MATVDEQWKLVSRERFGFVYTDELVNQSPRGVGSSQNLGGCARQAFSIFLSEFAIEDVADRDHELPEIAAHRPHVWSYFSKDGPLGRKQEF